MINLVRSLFSSDAVINKWVTLFRKIERTVEDKVAKEMATASIKNIVRRASSGGLTRRIDEIAESSAIDLLQLAGIEGQLLSEESGILEFGSRQIAVNMLDSDESDIFRESVVSEEGISNKEFDRVDLEVNIDKILLIIAMLVFIFELLYIKRRGDL